MRPRREPPSESGEMRAGCQGRFIKDLFLLRATGPQGATITEHVAIVVGLQLQVSRTEVANWQLAS